MRLYKRVKRILWKENAQKGEKEDANITKRNKVIIIIIILLGILCNSLRMLEMECSFFFSFHNIFSWINTVWHSMSTRALESLELKNFGHWMAEFNFISFFIIHFHSLSLDKMYQIDFFILMLERMCTHLISPMMLLLLATASSKRKCSVATVFEKEPSKQKRKGSCYRDRLPTPTKQKKMNKQNTH